MRRFVFVLVAAAAMLSAGPRPAAAAAVNYPAFANLAWGESRAAVKAALGAKGYTFTNKTQLGNDAYEGRLADTPTDLIAYFDENGRLVKVSVNIRSPDEQARSMYRQIRDDMIAKYGPPNDDFHFFSSPYYEGDGFELSAIRQGKGTFAAYWGPTKATPCLSLEITKKLTVLIGYESPDWSAFVDRHRANTIKDI